jgi:penicillin amidase
MTRLYRILMRTLLALFGILGAITVGIYFVLGNSLPDFDKTLDVQGISGNVEILRDSHAIPHIFAQSEADVYFGLGFAHAEDRLWQMLTQRRKAQGKLSEISGRGFLQNDILIRSLDIYTIAQKSLEYQSPEATMALESYAKGVNARLRTIRDNALGRGVPEMFWFDNKIAPWTPTDSLAILRLMAFEMTDKATQEVLQTQTRLLLNRSPERLRDLFPNQQGPAILALPEYDQTHLHLRNAPSSAPRPQSIPHVGHGAASNAFAVAPSRSAASASLLAVDPHGKLEAPGQFMLARLELSTGGVIGASIPGIPAIFMGRNENFGWGMTASHLDNQDIFIEQLKSDDPAYYLTPSGFKKFESRDVIIDIKGEPGLTVTLKRSHHGPLINIDQFVSSDIELITNGYVTVLAWTGLDPEDRSIDALIGLMKAQTVDQGRDALRNMHVLPLVTVMADRENIALQAAGRAPARDIDNPTQGREPSLGWLKQTQWQGYLPFESNPYVKNPDSGVIANTNNRLTDAAFPEHWSFEYGDDQRIQRAQDKLNERKVHTIDSMIEIQTDTVSPSARTLLALVAADLWYTDAPSAEGTVERRRQTALDLLADWSGDMTEHDPEPLIYTAWIKELQNRLIRDDLRKIIDQYTTLRALFIERVYRDIDGAAAWCDVVQTPRVETCSNIARDSLDSALQSLSDTYGERIESWRWGDAHQAIHRHPLLGQHRLFDQFVNIYQDTPGGDNTLLRGLTLGAGEEPFQNVHASTFRAIYDFSDPEASIFIIPTGQSGHPLSQHYDDLSRFWRRSEYIPMTLTPILARGGGVGETVLRPAQ